MQDIESDMPRNNREMEPSCMDKIQCYSIVFLVLAVCVLGGLIAWAFAHPEGFADLARLRQEISDKSDQRFAITHILVVYCNALFCM